MQEQKTITLCTKQAIAWANKLKTDADCGIGMQFIEQPRAIDSKSNGTVFYHNPQNPTRQVDSRVSSLRWYAFNPCQAL